MGVISAIAGDIAGTDDREDVSSAPVLIRAASVRRLQAAARKFTWDQTTEIRGGGIGAFVDLSGALGLISARGGDINAYVSARGSINRITATSVRCREDSSSLDVNTGGNLLSSVILPDVVYRSTVAQDYRGSIGRLNVTGTIRDSWIGSRGPRTPQQFVYGALVNSAICIDGQPVR